jgi:hypothetical protein
VLKIRGYWVVQVSPRPAIDAARAGNQTPVTNGLSTQDVQFTVYFCFAVYSGDPIDDSRRMARLHAHTNIRFRWKVLLDTFRAIRGVPSDTLAAAAISQFVAHHLNPSHIKGTSMTRVLAVFVVLCATVSVFTQPAHAYIDPGSASMAIQLLIAGFVIVTGGVVYYYRQIVATLSRWFSKPAKGPTESK